MAVSPGSRLGPYEIVAALGAGAMGEVYRARDTRLDRTVAIKVLGEHLAAQPSFQKRFSREGRAISALNHPNICTLYDVGSEDGVEFIVMEYLEGETLAAALQQGPLPFERLVLIGQQIASALARAHRHGVIHRDLKPANIMLTQSGVKLLDFGVALRGADGSGSDGATVVKRDAEPLTREGMLVGTIPYLAPELLGGARADARSDLFAFGCILYEMAVGARAFGGEETSLIAALVSRDPTPITDLRPEVPAAFDRLVRSCLAKDPEARWQSARDAMIELEWLERADPSHPATPGAQSRSASRRRWPAAAVAAVAAATLVGIIAGAWWPRHHDSPPPVARFSLLPPGGTSFATFPLATAIALSPNGRQIAFSAQGDGGASLWVQSLDESQARRFEGTEGAVAPFWAPDGTRIAFFAHDKLMVVPADGGPAQILADAPFANAGSWGSQGTLLFSAWRADRGHEAGLYRVPEGGGAPSPVVLRLEHPEWVAAWPAFLSDGKRFTFLSGAYTALRDERRICVGSIEGGPVSCLAPSDTRGILTPSGYLVSVRRNQLVSQAVDLRTLALRGEPKVLIAHVLTFTPAGMADFSVSDTGGLLAARTPPSPSRLVWFDRSGARIGEVGETGQYAEVRLSPDGRQVAAALEDETSGAHDLWLFDTQSGLGTKLLAASKNAGSPVWSPDGGQLAYALAERYRPRIRVHGFGPPASDRQLLQSDGVLVPEDWSHDGTLLAYQDYSADGLRFLPVRPGARTPTVASITGGDDARFSPDDRLLCFDAVDSTGEQVYVAPVADLSQRHRVSIAGGHQPHWRQDGKELFFLSHDNTMMAVDVRRPEPLELGTPRPLFRIDRGGGFYYDVSADGQRFLVAVPLADAHEAAIQIVTGWQTLAGHP